MTKIIPAILTSDENELTRLTNISEHVCDTVQIDLIDGKFANNKTVDIEAIEKIQTTARLEIQLMVVNPSIYINKLANLNYVSRIVFPLETNEDVLENIYTIKKFDKQAGISLNLETPVGSAFDYFNQLDFITLMGVKVGYSGQKLNNLVFEKINQVKKLDETLAIEVDGGINEENLKKLSTVGVDFAAVNSALFGTSDFYLAFEKLQKIAS